MTFINISYLKIKYININNKNKMSKKVNKKEESKILSLGAINKKTGKYFFAQIANKKDEYMCPDCNKDLVLCQGKVRIHHFRHKVEKENKCTYYDKPTEAQIHKDAKFLLKKLLEDNTLNIYFTRSCSCCPNLRASTKKIELNSNSKIIIEHRFNFNGSVKIADVAHINNNKIETIFEIYNTHQTKDIDRPEPWYEINATNLIELVQSTNLIENKTLDIRCIRPGKCNSCIKKEEKQKLVNYFKSDIIPRLFNRYKNEYLIPLQLKREQIRKEKEREREKIRKEKEKERIRKEKEREEKESKEILIPGILNSNIDPELLKYHYAYDSCKNGLTHNIFEFTDKCNQYLDNIIFTFFQTIFIKEKINKHKFDIFYYQNYHRKIIRLKNYGKMWNISPEDDEDITISKKCDSSKFTYFIKRYKLLTPITIENTMKKFYCDCK